MSATLAELVVGLDARVAGRARRARRRPRVRLAPGAPGRACSPRCAARRPTATASSPTRWPRARAPSWSRRRRRRFRPRWASRSCATRARRWPTCPRASSGRPPSHSCWSESRARRARPARCGCASPCCARAASAPAAWARSRCATPASRRSRRMTTPESLDLQRWLARMRDARVEAVAMEVSSHSLALGRVRGLRFAVAVFTQLASRPPRLPRRPRELRAGQVTPVPARTPRGNGGAERGRPVDAAPRGARARRREPGRDVRPRRELGRGLRDHRRSASSSRARSFACAAPTPSSRSPCPCPATSRSTTRSRRSPRAARSASPGTPCARGLESCPPVPGRLEPVRLRGARRAGRLRAHRRRARAHAVARAAAACAAG